MKKSIFLISTLLMLYTSFSQQTNPSPALTKQDYVQKSKKQKTAAWILLGGGAAMGVISAIADPGNDIVTTSITGDDGRTGLATAVGITGFVCMATSIPLFIAAHRNKKKGISLSIKNESLIQIRNGGYVYKAVPSINLKIRL